MERIFNWVDDGNSFLRGTLGWRWRMRTKNGKIVGAFTEAYRKGSMCLENLWLVTGFKLPASYRLVAPVKMTIILERE